MSHLKRCFRAWLVWGSLVTGLTAAIAQSWVPFQANWGPFLQATDASHLNKPLDASDALTVVGPHFKRVGRDLRPGTDDDTRVRLFGVNLTHEAAFPSPDQAREVARTLRSLGFNAVRLHHLDTLPTSNPAVFRSTLTEAAYPTLHPGAIARLKTFIDELKQQGIYINLNLMVGYAFRPQVDGVPALDQQGSAPAYGSAVHVFHPVMVARQAEHARQLIAALGLKDNPALAQVEIINESSLAGTWLHWDPNAWTQQIRGPYATELDRQWRQWLAQRHGSLEAACKRWTQAQCTPTDLALPSPEQAERLQHGAGSGVLHKMGQKSQEWLERHLLPQRADSVATNPDLAALHPKVLDVLQFVAEVDRRFVESLRKVVQDSSRTSLPVTGTQVNFGAPLNFVSHAAMDYVDAHFYVDHPEFPGANWSDTDWRMRNRPMSGGDMGPLLDLAAYRDPSRPFVVSEFNLPYPSDWGHEVMALTTAVAALQDWDGLYFFDYAQRHDGRIAPHNFNLQGDWPKLATVGMAARLFREGHVPSLPSTLPLPLSDNAIWFSAGTDRRPDAWTRHLHLRLKLPTDAAVRQRLALQRSSADLPRVTKAASPLVYTPADRLTSLVAPMHNLILGQSSGQTQVSAGILTLETRSPDEPVAVWLMALDGKPLGESQHMLLAAPSPVRGSQPSVRPPRPVQLVPYRQTGDWKTLEPPAVPAGLTSGSRTAEGPLWLRRDARVIRISHRAPQLQVFPLQANGSRRDPLPRDAVTTAHGQHIIRLNALPAQTALWFELIAP